MPSFADLLAQGGNAPWLYLPVALGLGALHALEPGHAKSMMAGFVVATRGTPAEAVLLGLSAAIAHSAVVWAIVLAGLWLGRDVVPEAVLPWLGLAAGAIALGIAGWMAMRLGAVGAHERVHRHGIAHDHGHAHGHDHHHGHPHACGHGHAAPLVGAARPTRGQILAFGFSGGLMPCPAALVVLMLCLQAGAVGLGLATVAAFSAGLALVLVGVGVAAAFGTRMAVSRFAGVEALARRAPWLSVGIIALAGLWTMAHAVLRLAA